MNSENKSSVPEIPNEHPPTQVLKELSLELRHVTTSIIGLADILQKLQDEQSNNRQSRDELLDHIFRITQAVKELFVQVRQYLETCEPRDNLENEKLEIDKTALLVFAIKFERHLQPIETWAKALQTDGLFEGDENGVAQIRRDAETLESLRVEVYNQYKNDLQS
jgi:hypothetical protein